MTPGTRVVQTLWPGSNRFDSAWGEKTAQELAECIDNLTVAPELLEACKAVLSMADRIKPLSEIDAEITLDLHKLLDEPIAKAEK